MYWSYVYQFKENIINYLKWCIYLEKKIIKHYMHFTDKKKIKILVNKKYKLIITSSNLIGDKFRGKLYDE